MMFKGLSGNALKVIAIVAMTIDHLAWVGIETYEQAETPTQIFLHCIGRLTAPMMIFFVAEGYHHTHDFRRYLRRLPSSYSTVPPTAWSTWPAGWQYRCWRCTTASEDG